MGSFKGLGVRQAYVQKWSRFGWELGGGRIPRANGVHVEVSNMCKQVSSPARPWSFVFAHDEITPGNILRPDNKRKFTSFYFSFAEFGNFAIRHEVVWFHLAVLRSSIAHKVVGGLSCAVRLLLKALLGEEHGFQRGVLLPLDDGPTLLFAKLQTHLGDEAALAQGLSLKGASGIRPCIKCANVLKKASELAGHRPNELVEITCTDVARFMACDDRDIWRSYDRLAAVGAHATRAEIERQERAAGLNINANGVIADLSLRPLVGPVSSLTFDWQHTYLSNGVASQEVHMFLKSCRQAGIADIWSLLQQYCGAEWSFPSQNKQKALSIVEVFNKTREKACHDHFKSGASELLTVYPLVRRFAESILLSQFPVLQQNVLSFTLCCKVLDMLQDAKGGVAQSDVLAAAICNHLQQHKRVYGEDDWKPKLHYSLHIPQQVLRDNMLFDCFVVERSHQVPKLLAADVKKTETFEKTVIARSLLVRVGDLKEFDERPCLKGKVIPFPEFGLHSAWPTC